MFVNPLVVWLWVAGILVALGGLVAVWPPPRSLREPAPAGAGGARPRPGLTPPPTAPRVIIAVVLVVILTLGVACAVAWPLVRGPRRGRGRGPSRPPRTRSARRELRETLDRSLAAIKEIEFDHRSGHLSDEDFAALDAAERARAVELIRRLDELGER